MGYSMVFMDFLVWGYKVEWMGYEGTNVCYYSIRFDICFVYINRVLGRWNGLGWDGMG